MTIRAGDLYVLEDGARHVIRVREGVVTLDYRYFFPGQPWRRVQKSVRTFAEFLGDDGRVSDVLRGVKVAERDSKLLVYMVEARAVRSGPSLFEKKF